MMRLYYDLHIHSCLSPCGDNDNTPNNILGIASLSGLDIVALTDHNTTKNCPAFFEASEEYGIVAVAGMELTTSEDIHVVCLFEELSDAMAFDSFIDTKRIKIKNKPEFFGEQLILDRNDNLIGKEDYLLSNATTLSIEDVADTVRNYGGVAYPAHIDRDSNGIVAILGTIPSPSKFTFYELRSAENIEEYSKRFNIDKDSFIISSDAHNLESVRDKENYLTLEVEDKNPTAVRRELFKLLRK
jgi:PHP family Zn ribbon phosphoesterase